MTTFYYTYKIIHLPTNFFYIGRRIFNGFSINEDRYMGSGTKIRQMLKIYPLEQFSKEIISNYMSTEDMIQGEIDLIRNVFSDPFCLNLCIGDAQECGMIQHSTKTRSKTSESVIGDKNPMFGKKHRESTIASMAAAKLGKISLFKEGKSIKVDVNSLPTLLREGWVPSVSRFDDFSSLCPSLTKEMCIEEKRRWKHEGFRVSKSRVNR